MQINPTTSPAIMGLISVCLLMLSPFAVAVPTAVAPAAKTVTAKPAAVKPALPTAQQFQQQIKQLSTRIHQLEEANQTALARNQELQLMNDNLAVQVQVLQSERSAQMFLYGAATLAIGAIIGFILCNSLLSKRSRRW
jgi:septal ring factor EnvC (AmiA/AmiB activator)